MVCSVVHLFAHSYINMRHSALSVPGAGLSTEDMGVCGITQASACSQGQEGYAHMTNT